MSAPVIWRADSPLCRCRVCGSQRQYHDRASEPHDLIPETLADYDPAELSPEQLVSEINRLGAASMGLTGWTATDADIARCNACRDELRARVGTDMGIDYDDLVGSIAA